MKNTGSLSRKVKHVLVFRHLSQMELVPLFLRHPRQEVIEYVEVAIVEISLNHTRLLQQVVGNLTCRREHRHMKYNLNISLKSLEYISYQNLFIY